MEIGFIVGIILWSFLIGALAVLIVDSVVLVPAYHYGVLERFRERTGPIYDEGLGFKIPLIDKVIPVSMALTPIAIEVAFTTKDKLQLKIAGSLQYRPDPSVKDEKGRNLFISMSEAIIKNGIEDMLRGILGGLGGVYEAESFISHRQALADIINNMLRFETPYHLRHDPGCVVKDCKHLGKDKIDAGDLIGFYDVHWQDIKEKQEEGKRREEMSSVERRYGISVDVFALSVVDFSADMKDAFEQKKEAEEREHAFNRKLDMASRAKAQLSIDGQVALNSADVSLNPEIARGKKVISVEGQAGVLGGMLDALNKK